MKAWQHIVDDSITFKEPSETHLSYYVPVYVIPAAVHDAQQTAIAAAEELAQAHYIGPRDFLDTHDAELRRVKAHKRLLDALAQLRAAKGEL